MPQPMKVLFVAFSAAIIVAEVVAYISSHPFLLKWAPKLPLLAAVIAILPYRSDLGYFDSVHQLLILLIMALGAIYLWAGSRLFKITYNSKK